MNKPNFQRVRSQPTMLLLLFLVASVFSSVLQTVIPLVLFHWTNLGSKLPSSFVSLIYQVFYFPFSLTVVLWLASRSGRTTWSTWCVPISMLMLVSAFPVVGMLFSMGDSAINLSLVDIMLVWQIFCASDKSCGDRITFNIAAHNVEMCISWIGKLLKRD